MKLIIRNILAVILVLTTWGMIISATVSMAKAQMINNQQLEMNPVQPTKPQATPEQYVEIKLICMFEGTSDFAIAMYILPEYQRGTVRPLVQQGQPQVDWIPAHLQEAVDGTEYRLWVQLNNGFLVFVVNRETLAYSVLQSIDMVGRELFQGGTCRQVI